jgi:hypothetical protein
MGEVVWGDQFDFRKIRSFNETYNFFCEIKPKDSKSPYTTPIKGKI